MKKFFYILACISFGLPIWKSLLQGEDTPDSMLLNGLIFLTLALMVEKDK